MACKEKDVLIDFKKRFSKIIFLCSWQINSFTINKFRENIQSRTVMKTQTVVLLIVKFTNYFLAFVAFSRTLCTYHLWAINASQMSIRKLNDINWSVLAPFPLAQISHNTLLTLIVFLRTLLDLIFSSALMSAIFLKNWLLSRSNCIWLLYCLIPKIKLNLLCRFQAAKAKSNIMICFSKVFIWV